MKTTKLNLSILFLFVFISLSSFGQTRDFSDYDANGDEVTDRQEFHDMYNTSFADWDRNGDNSIEDSEFYAASYNNVDRDGNDKLSSDEWYAGYDDVYGDYLDSRNFDDYDLDQDGNISGYEYSQSFRDTGYYNSFDSNRDGKVKQSELNENVFKAWDANGDGNLDQDEYDTYSAYYDASH